MGGGSTTLHSVNQQSFLTSCHKSICSHQWLSQTLTWSNSTPAWMQQWLPFVKAFGDPPYNSMSENHSQNCVICKKKLQGPPFKPPDLTPLRKVRVQEAAPFAVHRGGLYWTTICMMREWGDQMLYISLYLCCNKSGTLGSLFWLDREKMTALGYKKKSDQEVV